MALNPCQQGSLIVHAEFLVNRMNFRAGVMDEFLSYGLRNVCLCRDRDAPNDSILGRQGSVDIQPTKERDVTESYFA